MVDCRICGEDVDKVKVEKGLQRTAAVAGQVENGARAVRAGVALHKGGQEAMEKALTRGWNLEGVGSRATSTGTQISRGARR